MRLRAGIAVALAALVAACGESESPEREAPPAPKVRSAERLAADWWIWAAKRPEGRDPVTDRTGAHCRVDQPRDVFFLAGTPGGPARRKCTVSANRPLFFPVLNYTCPLAGDDPATAAAACADLTRRSKRTVTLDGRPVRDRFLQSPVYILEPHLESPYAGNGGESVAAGWYVMLRPLPAGRHRLLFSGRTPDGFSLRVRYDLTVRGADPAASGV